MSSRVCFRLEEEKEKKKEEKQNNIIRLNLRNSIDCEKRCVAC